MRRSNEMGTIRVVDLNWGFHQFLNLTSISLGCRQIVLQPRKGCLESKQVKNIAIEAKCYNLGVHDKVKIEENRLKRL